MQSMQFVTFYAGLEVVENPCHGFINIQYGAYDCFRCCWLIDPSWIMFRACCSWVFSHWIEYRIWYWFSLSRQTCPSIITFMEVITMLSVSVCGWLICAGPEQLILMSVHISSNWLLTLLHFFLFIYSPFIW